MAVLLSKAYGGHAAGTIREFSSELETALIAQGIATASVVASITTGAQTSDTWSGTVAVPIAGASLVVTNSLVKANSKVWACVAQASADGTFLRVERVVCADGSFTIYGTAGATAVTLVDWALLPTVGLQPAQ
jgi:hypothetical protein